MSQRRLDFLGVGLQHLDVLHLAGMWLERHALMARDDVEMQVEDRLTGGRLVELDDGDAVGVEGLLGGDGESSARPGSAWTAPPDRRRAGCANGVFGMTSVCPVACGITSMKASVSSSS